MSQQETLSGHHYCALYVYMLCVTRTDPVMVWTRFSCPSKPTKATFCFESGLQLGSTVRVLATELVSGAKVFLPSNSLLFSVQQKPKIKCTSGINSNLIIYQQRCCHRGQHQIVNLILETHTAYMESALK